MLKEQNQALRSEILRQKAKDEAKALLSNAFEHQAEVLGSVASGPSGRQVFLSHPTTRTHGCRKATSFALGLNQDTHAAGCHFWR